MNAPVAGNPLALSRRSLDFLASARWMLGYALVVETALQFLLKAWSEVLEIFLFTMIIGHFILATYLLRGARGVTGLVVDTWTQRIAAVFLAAMALTFLWGDQTLRSQFAVLRLPTYLVIIAMVVETLRAKERIRPLGWMALVSICTVYALAIFEFFAGSAALALECTDIPKCARFKQPGWAWPGIASYYFGIADFARHGGILNATIVGEAYGMGRLGLLALLAYALGVAIFLTSRSKPGQAVAGLLVTFVLCGQILTGSRSVTLAIFALCFSTIGAFAVIDKVRHFTKTLVLANLVVFAAVGLFWLVLPPGITSLDRISTYTPLGKRFGVLDGVFAGRAGLTRRAEKPIVSLRIEQVALDETYEVQMRVRGDDDVWHITEPIAAESSPASDGRSDCGDGNAPCGEILMTWHKLDATWGIANYEYRVRAVEDEWPEWKPFVAKSRNKTLAELKLASPSADFVIVHYTGGVVVDGWRTRNWRLAWDLFVQNPLGGRGFRTFQVEAGQRFIAGPLEVAIVGVHSGFLGVLAEAGLLGSIPLCGMLGFALLVMFRMDVGLTAPIMVWRVLLVGAFAAMLALNAIDTHSEDRFFWMVLAFAAVLEKWRLDANAETEACHSPPPPEPGGRALKPAELRAAMGFGRDGSQCRP